MTPRIAFIGAGQMARHHVNALRRLRVPPVVAGVYDSAPRRAAAFAAAAQTQSFSSLAEMLETRPDVVHVCTPPAGHFQAALAALNAGAHVYVEKPFALTASDARALLTLACSQRRLVCAGHQLLHDPAFEALMGRRGELGTILLADSHFTFHPVGMAATRNDARALAQQLVDILPHPLYSLVSVMERAAPDAGNIDLVWMNAGPTSVQAILRAGELIGRLFVSLRARPVASSLVLTGTGGALTCDFVRSIVVGAPNPGTEVLEKVLTPIVEGTQLISRTTAATLRRLRSGIGYPGLSELMGAFYQAVAHGGASPVTSNHLIRVTEVFEALVARIETEAQRAAASRSIVAQSSAKPRVVVTGAHGFLGEELARALAPVRGIGRGPRPDDPNVSEWVVADLSRGLPADALAGADIVVHAAAETAGGFDDHRRNTIAGTRRLLQAMHSAGVRRLLLVSSLSVLEPPRTPWERQSEDTPHPRRPRVLGPYTWGKCLQETLVVREAPRLGIELRVVRPGALTDWRDPTVPGLMGRRLFGRWHLGLGRPSLPIAVCDVRTCADAIAWCVKHFDEAPAVVHLFDPELTTRGTLAARMAERGWRGRLVWIPISVVALGLSAVRVLLSLCHFRWPARLETWSILRPRRYDPILTAAILERARSSAAAAGPLAEELLTAESKVG